MMDHSSRIVGSISVSCIHGLAEFLQQPLHPPSQVEVDATDCCSTVNQSSGFSDFFHFPLCKESWG